MAWIYSMWIESGESEEQGNNIRDYFSSIKEIETTIGKYPIYAGKSGPTGSMITVDGISRIGINSEKDSIEMSLIGNELYKNLRQAPDFRYALTGVEVDGWIFMDELIKDPNDIAEAKGFVIRKDIYNSVGSPGEFVEFSHNYMWLPYEGETFI